MKMIYIEPDDYFTESMKKILEEGDKDVPKKAIKGTAKKKPKESSKKLTAAH